MQGADDLAVLDSDGSEGAGAQFEPPVVAEPGELGREAEVGERGGDLAQGLVHGWP